jgi:hypothetical protein
MSGGRPPRFPAGNPGPKVIKVRAPWVTQTLLFAKGLASSGGASAGDTRQDLTATRGVSCNAGERHLVPRLFDVGLVGALSRSGAVPTTHRALT